MQYYEEQDYTRRFDAGLWGRLLRYAKPYRFHLLGIALSMLITAATDVYFPLLTREAIDTFIANGTTEGLSFFCVKYFGTVLTQVACIVCFCLLSGRVEVGMCRRIRTIGFKRLQELPFSFYDKTPVGYVIARMTSDTQRIGDTIGWGLIDLLWSIGYVLFTTVVMIRLDLTMSLAVLTIIPALAILAAWFQKRILKSYRETRKINSRITGSFNEGISGARTTKTLLREEANEKEFYSLTASMRDASVRAAVLSALFLPLVMSLASIAAAYALWLGGVRVSLGGMTLGTLTVFVSYSTQMFDPVSQIARIFAELQSSQAAAERVISLIETRPDISDSDKVLKSYGDSFQPKRENWPALAGDIEFEDVSFRYEKGEAVLSHFNLSVKRGQTIALVGETGAGKSTIVNLLCRFYEPTEGRILIDGADYRSRSQLWLHSQLGYVLQQPQLFSGSIRENIRYGRLDATDAEVEEAARRVSADGFIRGFENGYDEDIGEGGGKLSTGQKQLISFARAILADPGIFILDEATSSVDTETEQLIQRALRTALKGRTSFVIAHRLSTIRSADRILLIENGKVVEEGSHGQLIRLRGRYYNLYANQFREETERALLGK